MRITTREKGVISTHAKQIFGYGTQVILFGSRVNDELRGGDLDLLIIPPEEVERSTFFDKKIKFIIRVLDNIGEQKIDVIIRYPGDTRGIIQTALQEGVRIC